MTSDEDNKMILQTLMERAGVENQNQLADYLTQKYGVKIDRRQVKQFEKSKTKNLIHLLLREALEG